jgi:hypothetical protein
LTVWFLQGGLDVVVERGAGAVIMRLRRGESATIIAALVYLAMAAFVAWGRFGPGSFTRQTQRGLFSRAHLRRIQMPSH